MNDENTFTRTFQLHPSALLWAFRYKIVVLLHEPKQCEDLQIKFMPLASNYLSNLNFKWSCCANVNVSRTSYLIQIESLLAVER